MPRRSRTSQQFFKTYYAPNNAVLVVTGDIDGADARPGSKQYFAPIPAPTLPPKPDISEPRQEKEKRRPRTTRSPIVRRSPLGYHHPPRNTPEYYAMGLIDQILVQGQDSRLYQALVQKRGLTGDGRRAAPTRGSAACSTSRARCSGRSI